MMADNVENKPNPEARRPVEARGPEAPDGTTKGAAATTRAVDTLADAARRAVEQDQERVRAGVRAGAEAAATLMDPSRAFEAAAHIGDFYQRTMKDTAADMQALQACYMQLGQGFQRMQQVYFDVLQRSLQQARRKPQDLFFKSPEELAEIQHDLYLDAVAVTLECSTALLRAAGEMVRNAAGPLEARGR
jgi:hypothetical protein